MPSGQKKGVGPGKTRIPARAVVLDVCGGQRQAAGGLGGLGGQESQLRSLVVLVVVVLVRKGLACAQGACVQHRLCGCLVPGGIQGHFLKCVF